MIGHHIYLLCWEAWQHQPMAQQLNELGVQSLVDIRNGGGLDGTDGLPGESPRNHLSTASIGYHWAGRYLGGHYPAARGSRHTALDESLRGYADHMESVPFQRAVAQLINLAKQSNLALLFSEREPAPSGTRLLCDYLTLKGFQVLELTPAGQLQVHRLSPELRRDSIEPVYDRTGESG